MMETKMNYEKRIKTLAREIAGLRTKTNDLQEKESELKEMEKKLKQQKLKEQDLAVCSVYHTSNGHFQRSELRYFYFSYFWIRKDRSGHEFVLQRLCPAHYPIKLNSIKTNEQDPTKFNITSEVLEQKGRLILALNGQDVTDIPVMETNG